MTTDYQSLHDQCEWVLNPPPDIYSAPWDWTATIVCLSLVIVVMLMWAMYVNKENHREG